MLGALLHALWSGRVVTAWERLHTQFRSERIGWSKSGEFYCPRCSTIIGKNLLGESPFLIAAQHLRTHPGMGQGGVK
jgi:hypothetical protein